MIDEVLTRTTKYRLPPLAVGMGMYLPMSVTLIIPVGAFLGAFYNWAAERSGGNVEHNAADGHAAGHLPLSSVRHSFGVVFAGIVAATSDDSVLQIGDGFDKWAQTLGVIAFACSLAWLYNPHVQRISSAGVTAPHSAGSSPLPAQIVVDESEDGDRRNRLPRLGTERIGHDLRPGGVECGDTFPRRVRHIQLT